MTKIYDLIHQNNQIYMVDMNQKNNQLIGTWVWNDEDNSIYKTNIKSTGRHTDNIYTVSATTDLSLNLPLLPQIEENVDKIARLSAEEKLGGGAGVTSIVRYVIAFTDGYKAAKAKKYTEEDMKKAFFGGGNFKDIEEFNHLIQSLTPLPKQVEVEMNTHTFTTHGRGEEMKNVTEESIKVVNNFVQVKRWIYDGS